MHRFAQSLSVVVLLSGAVSSQSPMRLVLEGQSLPGGSIVTSIGFVAASRTAFFDEWLVQVGTDDLASPTAVVRNGEVWKQAGDAVSDPAGAYVAAFDSFALEFLFRGVVWNARLRNVGGAAHDQALYYQDSLWLEEGPVGTTATGFAGGTHWLAFDDVRVMAQDGGLLLRGRVDDPSVAGPDESFAAIGSMCGSVDALCGLERLAQEGLPAPGTSELIEEVRTSPASASISPAGWLAVVWSADLTGPAGTDGCVYRYQWPGPSTVLAREGTPSPVPGRTWGALEDIGVDAGDGGDWALRAALDASDPHTDEIIVRQSAVVVREGDTLRAIFPATFTGFGDGRPLLVGDKLAWFGRWVENGRPAEGIFLDDQLLVRTGATTVGGVPLSKIGSGPDDMALTAQDGVLVFKGTLRGGIEGAFALDLD